MIFSELLAACCIIQLSLRKLFTRKVKSAIPDPVETVIVSVRKQDPQDFSSEDILNKKRRH